MRVSYLIVVLSLVFSSVLSLTLDPWQQRDWCRIHHDQVYAKFRLYMKITKQECVMARNGMCTLDIENTNTVLTLNSKRTSFNDSLASFDASGIYGTVAWIGDRVQIPLSYLGVSYGLKSPYVYVNVSSWNPWEKATEELTKNKFASFKNLFRRQILAINLGCDDKSLPEPTTTPPATPELTTGEDEYDYESGSGLDLPTTPEPRSTRAPVDTHSNRKRRPDKLDFSLKVDRRCIKEVDLYFELKDACLHYRRYSPLRMTGSHGDGDQVRREMKTLGSSYRTCRLNTSPDEEDSLEPQMPQN